MSRTSPESTERFSDRVENYLRYRPTYPPQALEILRTEAGLQPWWSIADLGSGTGISSELFLRNGNTVYGVEPNAPMRAAAERLLHQYSNFTSVAGSAESTTLPTASVEAVIAAQAFHWFNIPLARRESQRILRPGGMAIVMWNTRRLDATPFLRAYDQLLIEQGTDYLRVRHDRGDPQSLRAFFGGTFATRSIPHHQRLTHAGLKGRILSSSYVPSAGQPGYSTLVERIDQLFQEHQQNGEVEVQYDAELHFGALV